MLPARQPQKLAEATATFCCAVFFGAAAYISLVQHPAALETGSDFAVRFFAPMYRRASVMQASLAIVGTIAAISAWFLGAGRTWLLVAILIGSVVPFTLVVVEAVNDQIKAIDPHAQEAVELLSNWGRLHLLRTVTSGVAFVLSLAATTRRPYR
jgi:uncharacterized membrane protein